MKFSKLGLGLAILFLFITIIPSIYIQLIYGDNQWMWGFIFGGMPLSTYGFSILWFATSVGMIILGWIALLGSYFLNLSILYLIGYSIEKLYNKIKSSKK